jgi:hypothetical protein
MYLCRSGRQRKISPDLIEALKGAVTHGWWTMFDINMEIEILERCASECALISNLATDRRARLENGELAAGYRLMAANLKSYAQKSSVANYNGRKAHLYPV